MQKNAWVLFGCVGLFSAAAFGQSQAGSSSSTSQEAPKSGYVRRFSAGATLGVLGLPFIANKSTNATSGSILNSYDTTNSSQRIGLGITAQVAITDHIAVSGSALYRRVGYQMHTTTQTGTTTITVTGSHEDTRATAFEIPVTVRYYVKGRYTKGPHFFLEGGAALLKASNVRTSIDTTDSAGNNACCTTGKTNVANRTSRGYVGGLGLQLIDPVGIRVVPEVRYTRWTNEMFHNLSTITQRNQIEAVISLTF